MVKKLIGVAFVVSALWSAAPAPAIDYLCSCRLCTNANSGLGCRDDHNGFRFTSCGTYAAKYCR